MSSNRFANIQGLWVQSEMVPAFSLVIDATMRVAMPDD